jgi:hypothetical protein
LHNPLTWDEQYAPFIWRVGFLPLARLVTDGLLIMDSAALTALVDRWHLETHMFHLPCDETTMTLQDVAMILGLPIDGTPVCRSVIPTEWRDSVGVATACCSSTERLEVLPDMVSKTVVARGGGE